MSSSGSSSQFKELKMFMTAPEIMDEFQPFSGDRKEVKRGNDWDVENDDELWDRKAAEAAIPGSHGKPDESGEDPLYDRVKREGVKNPVLLQADPKNVGDAGKPEILGGHHRLAVMALEHPDHLMPVEHYESLAEAKWVKGKNY